MVKWMMSIITACACVLELSILLQKAATHLEDVQNAAAAAKMPEAPYN